MKQNPLTRGPRRIYYFVATIVTAMALVCPGVAANAAPGTVAAQGAVSTVAPIAVKLTGRMVADCASLTPQARAYAEIHGISICGITGGSSPLATSGVVTPNNELAGDCGTSWVFLSLGGGGTVWFDYGFQSTEGNAIVRNLGVAYSIGSSASGISDVSVMNNWEYENMTLRYFGSGTVHAQLQGTVTLWWGLVCYMAGPTSSITV